MKFKRFTAACSAAAMLLSLSATLPAHAADVCSIDTSEEHQNIRGFGGIDHPEWTGSSLTAAQQKTAFGNGNNELGLTVLRVFVNPDRSQWNKALPTAQYATKMGATIFASPWEPPASLAESGGSNGKLHLPKSNYAAYAEHLNDFGTYMKENGVDLYAISVQNEPDYASEWTYWSTDETTDFIANYGDRITSTRLMSPESFQYAPENASWVADGGKKYYKKILNNSKAMENCDVFGTHFYGTQRDWMDYPELEACGKEIWMTEVYVPNSDADSANRYPEALQVSENIHNAMVVGNMSAYTWWYIRRSYGLMTEDGNISKRGYCMAQYSKFVRPGDVRIGATESPEKDVYVSAYKNPEEDQVTIVAINKGADSYSQQFSIDSGETISDVDRYRTSANENIALTENLEYTGSSFWAQLPAESVSTFVVSLGDPEDPKTDADGYYFHDTFEGDTFDWSGRGAAEVTLSGRTAMAGAESLLVQGRTAAWNGASKALPAKQFKAGSSYSFSVDAMYFDGSATDTFCLKLQYTGADGETQYATIAQAQAVKGEWVQLANPSYAIPADAKDMVLYVETAESTNSFYIDEAIGAPDGTKIDGPAETAFACGDINSDGVIDVFDLGLAKRGIVKGFPSARAELAADVDESGTVEVTDLIALQKFIHHQIAQFPKAETIEPTTPDIDEKSYMEQARNNIVNALPAGADTQTAGVDYGTMQSYSYYSTTRERMTPVNVLLPAGYNENETYPVLYMLHGYWETQDTLAAPAMNLQTILGNQIAAGEAEKMIVVFPYIYTSKTQESCSGLNLENSLNYDNFINDLKADLMPWVAKTFSIKTGRENTAISGFSMGGRESQFIGLSMSDTFGYIGAVCPAPGLTPGADLSQHPGQMQEGDLKFANTPYLFLLSGAVNDSVVGNQPEMYHNIYTNNATDHIWNPIPGGGHDGNSIRPHFYNLVRNLFHVGS